jgi:hypothetical protein
LDSPSHQLIQTPTDRILYQDCFSKFTGKAYADFVIYTSQAIIRNVGIQQNRLVEGLLSSYFACLYLWSKFQFELGMAHFAFLDYLGSLGLTLMDYHGIAGV